MYELGERTEKGGRGALAGNEGEGGERRDKKNRDVNPCERQGYFMSRQFPQNQRLTDRMHIFLKIKQTMMLS